MHMNLLVINIFSQMDYKQLLVKEGLNYLVVKNKELQLQEH